MDAVRRQERDARIRLVAAIEELPAGGRAGAAVLTRSFAGGKGLRRTGRARARRWPVGRLREITADSERSPPNAASRPPAPGPTPTKPTRRPASSPGVPRLQPCACRQWSA